MLITPLPGTARADLLRNLRWAREKATSLRNPSPDHWRDYINWAIDVERLLRTQLREADIARLVRTPRHMVILTNPPTGPILINAEIDERITAFDETITAFEGEANRWDRGGKLVVPDTSFFISHPTKVENTDFSQLLGCREMPVRLIIPMVVVDELDSLKKASQQRRRWRAAYAIAVIDRVAGHGEQGRLATEHFTQIVRGGIPRGEVTIEILLDPPGHTRLPINDDEIIDRAVAIKATASRDVTLLTYDTGHATRGRVADLEVRKLVEPKEDRQTDGFD